MQTLDVTNTDQRRNQDPFLVIEKVSKVYPTPRGPYTVLEDVNLTVYEGEFVCVIGHSGCGKSTLLNMVAGFNRPTAGEISLRSKPILRPGPDRMVVFQNYSLLPWMTAFENVFLAVKQVYTDKSKEEKIQIAKHSLELVGLSEAMHKKPKQLSGGMRQRVAIARALSIRPEVLILDEPFGALDVMTREELQDELLAIWRENQVTALMITHEIDEALFLADRIVLMSNGPAAHVAEIVDVPFARPRNRKAISDDPQYYTLRNYILEFLYNRFALADEAE
ncbi:MAG: nitrate ABC transporter ATP-binding protein [Pseudanabaenaceae cyanobacterium bins.39]|nr:nitrate ABC transporter ATP-binding protein [Pseudanabaenaceae cyanobacterium bins.39]